ncbi:hypothetical protein [Streptomyces sp. 4F14]|uniref:hypothetical protein n=1 Tax=Streptomyces sp. 4F14 TaxID=3394380 RepID=UPI003A87E9D6
MFSTDPGDTCDVDIDTSRDAPTVRPVRSALTTPPPGTANLAFSHRSFPLVAGGDAVKIPFSFVNLAGTCTRHPARFTFCTPYHCDIPTEDRPPDLTALYENTSDPTIPSVHQLEIPPGPTGRPHTVEIPFRIAAGAPVGPTKVQGIIVPTGTDTQGDRSTAHRKFGLMSV